MGGYKVIHLLHIDFTTPNGSVFREKDGSIQFVAERAAFRHGLGAEQKNYTFTAGTAFEMEEYFVLEYACQGIRRQLSYRKPFVFAITEMGEAPLVCYDDISMDNRRHSVIVRAKAGNYTGIKIMFSIDRRTKAHFTVFNLYSCAEEELPVCCTRLETETHRGFSTIDISQYYNAGFQPAVQSIIDGGRFFDKEKVCLSKIPFRVKPSGMNMIAPPHPPAENEEVIMNFGAPAKRRLCRPKSRDSLIEIPIDKELTELFFVMALGGRRHQRWGFASDGPILGSYCGDVTMPLLVDDTEGFMVELVYANGNRDTALPMNLSLGRHGIQGDVSVYAVPGDGSLVEKVVFHNRMLDTNCSIIAITLNQTGERLLPEMLTPEQPEKIEHKIGCEKEITLHGPVLTIQNGAISMAVDISKGMKLLNLINEYTPQFTVVADDMLKIREGDGRIVTCLTLINTKIDGYKAELTYRYQALEICVRAELTGRDAVKWKIRTINTGVKSLKMGVLFPCISGIQYADPEDGWYFLPKYQNMDSNETVFMYEESAPSFPMQFLDVYSPSQQGGLSLTTQERELVVRKYALKKEEDGIGFFVEYPAIYGELMPGKDFTGSSTVLTAHSGDWRKSFELYQNWLKSWYEPVRCQNKQWYRECFWLLAEITDFFETEEFTKLPIWYDKERKEFNLKKILEEQKEIAGCYPDILHLWSWTFRNENGNYSQQWGNFGSTDYDEYGGLASFKDALHEVTDEKGVKVSLYLHPTLLSGRYPQAEKYFPKHRVVNKAGEYISIEGDSYRMCHANEEWRKYAISMYPRIYQELGIPILYVDEFSLRIENRCYGDGHGHPVPSNLLKTDRDFISELKAAMPEEVVLYGEYAAVDVNARYIDCNISYYIIDSVVDMIETAWRGGDGSDRMGRVFTNLYRFAFPKIVQLILPMAMRNLSWHPQKFIFFNGEAIYDSFWDCEESAGLAFTVKAYGLKKKYADCFTSDNPQTMVNTLSPAVCANCFPGKGRTVYTLYNRAYTTYRGKILRVPHQKGAVYYDAWNEQPLQVEIKDGCADISLTIDAQQIGCIEISYQTL